MPIGPKLIPRSEHFTHYAVQWTTVHVDALGASHLGTWKHVDLEGGALAIFRTDTPARACAAELDGTPNVAVRIVRYHTSGYTDIAEVPDAPVPSRMMDLDGPDDEWASEKPAPRARARTVREIEVIE